MSALEPHCTVCGVHRVSLARVKMTFMCRTCLRSFVAYAARNWKADGT